ANRELQGALAIRDEEIAGLRADVAFYERLVGSTAQRRGLNVHAIRMQPQSERAWHFSVTLTRNLDREVVSAGNVTLSIEGSLGGRLQTLEWEDLRQQPGAPGVGFSFRYFQQVRGDAFPPATGRTPGRTRGAATPPPPSPPRMPVPRTQPSVPRRLTAPPARPILQGCKARSPPRRASATRRTTTPSSVRSTSPPRRRPRS